MSLLLLLLLLLFFVVVLVIEVAVIDVIILVVIMYVQGVLLMKRPAKAPVCGHRNEKRSAMGSVVRTALGLQPSKPDRINVKASFVKGLLVELMCSLMKGYAQHKSYGLHITLPRRWFRSKKENHSG